MPLEPAYFQVLENEDSFSYKCKNATFLTIKGLCFIVLVSATPFAVAYFNFAPGLDFWEAVLAMYAIELMIVWLGATIRYCCSTE